MNTTNLTSQMVDTAYAPNVFAKAARCRGACIDGLLQSQKESATPFCGWDQITGLCEVLVPVPKGVVTELRELLVKISGTPKVEVPEFNL